MSEENLVTMLESKYGELAYKMYHAMKNCINESAGFSSTPTIYINFYSGKPAKFSAYNEFMLADQFFNALYGKVMADATIIVIDFHNGCEYRSYVDKLIEKYYR